MQIDLDRPLSVIIVGASGDLARKKLLPALFALYSQGLLPAKFNVFGFARSAMDHDAFRALITEHLTCRYVPEHNCAQKMDEFLARCFYVQGQYGEADSFLDLYQAMAPLENRRPTDRLYYFAIPPSIFTEAAQAMGSAGLLSCVPGKTWSRVIIEKPFGRDSASSEKMARDLANAFPERDIYRIDHYLGKEIVQNLLVLRFANALFEPVWNHQHIEQVQITWKEDIGIESRAGYFDEYGILRDVVQNHLMQILSLVAMERPPALNAQSVRDAKLRVMKQIAPLKRDDLVIGQYQAHDNLPAYTEEKGVPADSVTPTYAAMALEVNNERWAGVPFLVRAGKGLDQRVTEIQIQFKPVQNPLFEKENAPTTGNRLIIRVQPDEAIGLRILNKVPGLQMVLKESELDLTYSAAFDEIIPDAYEGLILDAIEGDKSLFIRSDVLAAAWAVFTPILHELEQQKVKPDPYVFGSDGPEAAQDLAARHGGKWV